MKKILVFLILSSFITINGDDGMIFRPADPSVLWSASKPYSCDSIFFDDKCSPENYAYKGFCSDPDIQKLQERANMLCSKIANSDDNPFTIAESHKIFYDSLSVCETKKCVKQTFESQIDWYRLLNEESYYFVPMIYYNYITQEDYVCDNIFSSQECSPKDHAYKDFCVDTDIQDLRAKTNALCSAVANSTSSKEDAYIFGKNYTAFYDYINYCKTKDCLEKAFVYQIKWYESGEYKKKLDFLDESYVLEINNNGEYSPFTVEVDSLAYVQSLPDRSSEWPQEYAKKFKEFQDKVGGYYQRNVLPSWDFEYRGSLNDLLEAILTMKASYISPVYITDNITDPKLIELLGSCNRLDPSYINKSNHGHFNNIDSKSIKEYKIYKIDSTSHYPEDEIIIFAKSIDNYNSISTLNTSNKCMAATNVYYASEILNEENVQMLNSYTGFKPNADAGDFAGIMEFQGKKFIFTVYSYGVELYSYDNVIGLTVENKNCEEE